jgi:hypothetical protein
MKKFIASLISCCLLTACVAPPQGGPSPDHGFNSASVGLGQLILAPFMIVAGLLEGIASLPYFLAMGLHDLNRELVASNAPITLDDTYESAYGARLSEVPANGSTGVVFRRMKHASEYFQKILREYGVHDSERYFLTSVKTANGVGYQGYTLYAVVYRPRKSIQVFDKHDSGRVRQYTTKDRLFYEPHQRDSTHLPLDIVVDWAAVQRKSISTQKGQAILMTLAANSVLTTKRSPGYWNIEQRWIAGEHQQIVAQRTTELKKRMGI